MKRLDASETGIYDIRWSADGKWLSYVAGDEVRLANAETGETRIVGPGCAPLLTPEDGVIFEQADEIRLAQGKGIKTLVTKNDLVKETPKRGPSLSPDGETLLFIVCNVFDKKSQSLNAYPYRHFWGLTTPTGSKPRLSEQQWYGGFLAWFPDSSHFAHFEFDSTAGPQIHIVETRSGEREGVVAGLYPSVSPDSTRIAAKPRNGGSVVVYATKDKWTDDAIEMSVVKLPVGELRRPSANPPVWLDNRLLLVPEKDAVYRVDTKKEKAEVVKKFPLPTFRRAPTMVASPDRELLAIEVQTEDGFELRVGKPS